MYRECHLGKKRLGGRWLVLALVFLLTVVLANAAFAKSDKAKSFRWKMQTCSTSSMLTYKLAVQFAKDIEVATNGRMKIKVHAAGAVVPYAEVTDAVKNGVIQLGTPNASIDFGRIGPKALLLGASGATGGLNPIEYMTWYYTAGGENFLQKLYDAYNIKVVGIISATPAELFAHSSKPLTELKDFKGLKFRTMGLWGQVLTKMGASVVNISGGEIYESMQRGVIDAFEFCGPGINWDMGYVDVAKYVGVPGIHSPLNMENLLVNKKAWAKLPADMKEIFLLTTKAYSLKSFMALTMDDAEKFKKFQESGKVKIFEVSTEMQKKIVKVTNEIHAKYCKEVPGYKDIYDSQRNFVKIFKNLNNKVQPKLSVYDQ